MRRSARWWDRANTLMCVVAVVFGLGAVAFLEHQVQGVEARTQSQAFGSAAVAAPVVWRDGKPCCSACGAEVAKESPYCRCCGHSCEWTTVKCEKCGGCGHVSCTSCDAESGCACQSERMSCPECGGDGVLGN